jgi:hypothetical protein
MIIRVDNIISIHNSRAARKQRRSVLQQDSHGDQCFFCENTQVSGHAIILPPINNVVGVSGSLLIYFSEGAIEVG